MRWSLLLLMVVSLATTLPAHHPNKKCQEVHPRCDLIGPLGNRLPMSYRRRYNRPRYLGGKIAYLIAPSSQEAMAWHDAVHLGAYKNHRPRIEKHFFYPKPWEALRVGPREISYDMELNASEYPQPEPVELPPADLASADLMPAVVVDPVPAGVADPGAADSAIEQLEPLPADPLTIDAGLIDE